GRVDENAHAAECLAEVPRSRRRGTSPACGSDPRSARSRSYARRRIRASRPSRTVSVSVLAPAAARASRRSRSSMCSVFFIRTIVPYQYGVDNDRPLRRTSMRTASQLSSACRLSATQHCLMRGAVVAARSSGRSDLLVTVVVIAAVSPRRKRSRRRPSRVCSSATPTTRDLLSTLVDSNRRQHSRVVRCSPHLSPKMNHARARGLAAGDDVGEYSIPGFEGLPRFGEVGMFDVVPGRHSVSSVIQRPTDHLLAEPEPRKTSADRAPQILPLVGTLMDGRQRSLVIGPGREPWKNPRLVLRDFVSDASQHRQCGPRKWHYVGSAVLRSRAWQFPRLVPKIDLVPPHADHFCATLTEQQSQSQCVGGRAGARVETRP